MGLLIFALNVAAYTALLVSLHMGKHAFTDCFTKLDRHGVPYQATDRFPEHGFAWLTEFVTLRKTLENRSFA